MVFSFPQSFFFLSESSTRVRGKVITCKKMLPSPIYDKKNRLLSNKRTNHLRSQKTSLLLVKFMGMICSTVHKLPCLFVGGDFKKTRSSFYFDNVTYSETWLSSILVLNSWIQAVSLSLMSMETSNQILSLS